MISLGVVGHESRLAQVDRLKTCLDPCYVSVDDGTLGCGGNHLLVLTVLRDAVRGGGWAVVLEDDAQPVDNLLAVLPELLDTAPSPLVSLYNGTGYPQQYQRQFGEAAASDVDWILHSYLRHAVGYALRSDILLDASLLKAIRTRVDRRWAPDDAISAWATQNRVLVAYSNPSVVDHEDGKSAQKVRTHLGITTYGRGRQRRAHNFGAPQSFGRKTITI